MKQSFCSQPGRRETEPSGGRAPITLRVIKDERKPYLHLVLYSANAKTRLRGFLRELGIRPRGSAFQNVLLQLAELPAFSAQRPRSTAYKPPRIKTCLAVYRASGDAWLRLRTLDLPFTSWGRLAQFCMGQISAGQLLGSG